MIWLMAFKTQWEIQLISNLIWIGRKAFFEHQKTNIEASKVVGVMNRRNEHQRQLSSKTEGGLKIVYYCIEQFHLEYRLGKMSFYSLQQHCSKQIQKWMMIEKMKSRAFISKATIQYRVSQIPLCKCYPQ